jgi:hypothetical protein
MSILHDLWKDLWTHLQEPEELPPSPVVLVQPPAYMVAIVSIVMVLTLIIALVALIDRGHVTNECDRLRDENFKIKEKLAVRERIANDERNRLQDANDFMSNQLEISTSNAHKQSIQIRDQRMQIEELSMQIDISYAQRREDMMKFNAMNSKLELLDVTYMIDNMMYEGDKVM